MFASRTTKDLEMQDGDRQVVVTIRKLSGNSLDKASEAHTIAARALVATFDKETIKAFQDGSAQITLTPEQKRKAQYSGYDRSAVLTAGIVSWTAVDEKGKPVPLAQGIEDLDLEDALRLHESILELSLPPLDHEEQQAKV